MTKTLTVGKLIRFLQTLDPHLPVLRTRYSVMEEQSLEDFQVMEVFKKPDGLWWEEYEPEQWKAGQPRPQVHKALHIDGN